MSTVISFAEADLISLWMGAVVFGMFSMLSASFAAQEFHRCHAVLFRLLYEGAGEA